MKQRIFIGSSSEKLEIARAIQSDLDKDHEPIVWNEGIFDLSQDILTGLLNRLDQSDAAVFVLAPDDMTRLRNENFKTARDNVVFELGLFIGRLGRERTYFVIPRGEKTLHLPTDLLGLVAATYNQSRSDLNWPAAVAPACDQIREALAKNVQNVPAKSASIIDEGQVWMQDYVNKALRVFLTKGKFPSLEKSGIRECDGGYTTQIGDAKVSVSFGLIQSHEATEPGFVVALPANDLFDDECIDDPRSALGAYVQHAFVGKEKDLRTLIAEKLVNEVKEEVKSSSKQTAHSYGVAKCIYLANPLESKRKIILVSVTTKRAGDGVRSEAPYLFAAMRSICREMNDHKLTHLYLPVMGSGHGGLVDEVALFHLLLSVRAVLEDRSAGAHLLSVCIVVFQKDAATTPAIPRDVVSRIMSVAKATF
jgi:O-acetyl-ADP-ribose deacetylase (regulator of RNase III)